MRLALALLLCSTGLAAAQARHPCAADAIAKAMPLLNLHVDQAAKMNAGIDESVKMLPSIKALKGKGRLDVLEVWGHVYKADYRMRFIYAQTKGCLLMGQEILEASDPY